jgi:hypothetical protein
MKFLIHLLFIVVFCFVLQYFLPWWAMAIAALGVSYFIGNKPSVSFLAGFLGVGILWFGMAYYTDVTTQSILTLKINNLLPVNAFLMTALVGGLVGGFASMTGAVLKTK